MMILSLKKSWISKNLVANFNSDLSQKLYLDWLRNAIYLVIDNEKSK